MMMTKTANSIRCVFFGTGPIARTVLEELLAAGIRPALVVTAPDRPQGRGLVMTPSPVASYAAEAGLSVAKPERLDAEVLEALRTLASEVFIVADYGAILKPDVLAIPPKGVINMHPSLLPRLRGPSPIRSAILTDERDTGVSVMLIDAEMDHGPVIAQKHVAVPEWPPAAGELETLLSREGGALLAQVLPAWIAGEIEAHPQNHDLATYTKKLQKQDGELDLGADPYQNLLRIRGLEGWPGTFAFFERGGKRIRVQILDAFIQNGALRIERVKPEGKGEMGYEEFVRSGATQA